MNMASARAPVLVQLPLTFRKLVCTKLTQNFREAVEVQTVKVTEGDLKPNELLIKNRYVGINASDINLTAGRYSSGAVPPFDTGMESLGEVVWAGGKCQLFKPGDKVATSSGCAFSEYMILSERRAIPIPNLKPEILAFIVSGCTASVSLEKVGDLKPNEKVLVTAAAGGTGQFAVQLARLAGCHVIGICSSDNKAEFLKSIGCHRPINYAKEDLAKVLREEYSGGIDVIYESVGGEIFNTCVKNLAVRGRLIIIGMITHYQESMLNVRPTLPLQQILLMKSASLRGFFLPHYMRECPEHILRLVSLESTGELQVKVDTGADRSEGQFKGLLSVPDAVDYLYAKKSYGKIVVDLNGEQINSKL